MIYEFLWVALVTSLLMSYVIFKQAKEIITDGPLTRIKLALFTMGIAIFLSSLIGASFQLSKITSFESFLSPILLNRVNLYTRLINALMLFLIYRRIAK